MCMSKLPSKKYQNFFHQIVFSVSFQPRAVFVQFSNPQLHHIWMALHLRCVTLEIYIMRTFTYFSIFVFKLDVIHNSIIKNIFTVFFQQHAVCLQQIFSQTIFKFKHNIQNKALLNVIRTCMQCTRSQVLLLLFCDTVEYHPKSIIIIARKLR